MPTKTHEYDPNKCKTEDCFYLAALGTKFCEKCLHKHGHLHKAKKMYELGIWADDKKRFDAGSTSVKDELAISRMVTEKLIKTATDEASLIVAAEKIDRLNSTTVKIASIQYKMDQASGQLLDKSTVLQFADNIIKAVSEIFADDPDGIKEFADKILELCENLSPHVDDKDELD